MSNWFNELINKNKNIDNYWGVNSLIDIEKSEKDISKLIKKEITVTRNGKSFRQTVYVKPDETKVDTPIGGELSPTVKGMNITKYTDKSLIITGDTYVNLDTLRAIKKETGFGSWNMAKKGWIFPIKFVEVVLGYIWSDLKSKGEDDKAQAVQNQKNAGLEKGDKANIQGLEGKVDENVSDSDGTKYNVTLGDGTKLDGVDEKVIDVPPSIDDKKITETLNNATPENRVTVEKKIYGIKSIENIQNYSLQEYMGMHGLSEEDIQKVVNSFTKPKETPTNKPSTGGGGGGKSGGYTSPNKIHGLTKQQLIGKLVYQHYQAVKKAVESGEEVKPEALTLYSELRLAYLKKRQAMSEETKRKISEALKKNKAEEAKAAAQKMIDSLSPKDIKNIKESFQEAISEVVQKEQSILAEMIVEKEKLEKEKQALWDKAREYKDDYGKAEVWKAKARLINTSKLETKVRAQQNKVQVLSNGGDTASLSDKVGIEYKDIPDFRKVSAINIDYNVDNVLTIKKPDYIPEINFDEFKSGSYIFDMIKVSDDSYLLSTNKYREKSLKEHGAYVAKDGEYDPQGGGFVIVTLDQLVLTQDYYITKQKALFRQEAERKNKRQEEYWDKKEDKDKERWMMQRGMYRGLPAKIKKEVTEAKWDSLTWQEREKIYKPVKKYGSEKIKSRFDTRHMAGSFHSMYERFVNPKALRKDRSGKTLQRGESSYSSMASSEAWDSWTDFRQTLDWKINDINIQREELSDVRKKALETSYGDINTNDSYVDELGVKMKRQNGEIIKPKEMDQLKDAWVNVQETFGSLKENAKKDNLKLSHAGSKYMYASTAIGVYYPSYKAIGVTAKLGEDQLGFTMSHEVGHWIDGTLGTNKGRRHESDNFDSTAGKIATLFRKNMNKESKSNYINATHECFARALEQFHAIETKGEYATRAAKDPYITSESYVSKDVYENQLKPLIKQFLDENKEFLKAIGNTLFG